MITRVASALGLLLLLSEAGLGVFKHAKADEARAADRGSLRLLWVVIVVSAVLAYGMAASAQALAVTGAPALRFIGVALFATGLALRWYSIIHLGRFFTVNVAIAADHRVIDTGPYRYIRHPSYTGALMAFVGLGLCLRNWGSLAVLMIPTFLVFARRMTIEEDALGRALGDEYRDYLQRTKRLIPFVY